MESVFGSEDPPTFIIIKRLWDETSMRLQMSFADLAKLLGQDIAEAAREIKVKGRGVHYPGYVVQSMQQMAFIRWGSRPEEACEIVVSGKIIASNDSDSILNSLMAGIVGLSIPRLRALCARARVVAMHMFPDAHPSNRGVLQHIYEELPRVAILEGHCVSHMLQLVWDGRSKTVLANPLYQLIQLLSNGHIVHKVNRALEAQALEAEVQVGVSAELDFNKFVLIHLSPALQSAGFFHAAWGSKT